MLAAQALKPYTETKKPNCTVVMWNDFSRNGSNGSMIIKSMMLVKLMNARMMRRLNSFRDMLKYIAGKNSEREAGIVQ